MSPTARTLQLYRQRGCLAQKVEQTIPHTFIKRDLFGFIDGIALDRGIVGWQATTGDHLTERIAKIRGECREAALAWLEAGGRIEVWGWRQLKVKRGGKAVRWQPDIRVLQGPGLVDCQIEEGLTDVQEGGRQ